MSHLVVEQVELRAFLEEFAEISMVDIVLRIFQANQVFLFVSVLVNIDTDEVGIPTLHGATDVSLVDFQSLLVRAIGMGDKDVQFVGNIDMEDG